jgi:hypothetical protein
MLARIGQVIDKGVKRWLRLLVTMTFNSSDNHHASLSHSGAKWLQIWKRQPDGGCKLLHNIWNPDE